MSYNISTNRLHTPGPKFESLLVFTHTTSSHLLYPHFPRISLPLSRPSPAPLPTQRKIKDGSAASEGIDSFSRCPQLNEFENGGSIKMTSNFRGSMLDSCDSGRNKEGKAASATAAFFRANNRCCLGYLGTN